MHDLTPHQSNNPPTTSRPVTASAKLPRVSGGLRGLLVSLVMAFACAGCGTTINRVATEQLLLSDAVDEAVGQLDFSHFKGQRCYLDATYLRPNPRSGIVNSEYIISSLRQQIVTSGALLQANRSDADVIFEPRVGALGTDGHEIVYGVPQGGSIAGAATALSGAAIPIPAIPEIAFGKNDSQHGIAKISVFAYDQATRQPVWQSGIAKAETSSDSTWVLGAGPFQKGSVYEGIRFAGRKLPERSSDTSLPPDVAGYEVERVFAQPKSRPVDVAQKHESPVEPVNDPTSKSESVKQVSHLEAAGYAIYPRLRK